MLENQSSSHLLSASSYQILRLLLSFFQVEAIGDAYMVVSGAPEEIQSHPERLANTALGMLIAAREVASPYDYKDGTPCVKVPGVT